ncbi:MAG: sigma-70 family RNA polymerase sigma factor [Gemmatimonadaceae bacterium]
MATTGPHGEELSDTALVARMAAGDERALGLLYDRHGQVAYGLALAITSREAVAEQVVADSFSEVWQHARSYVGSNRALGAVVVSVVRRQALAARGTKSGASATDHVIDRRILIEPTSRARASGERSASEQSRDTVIGVLSGLPPVQRRVLELAYFGGLPVREIALETDESEEQVTAQLRSAMDALRRTLSVVSAHPPESAITRA